MVFTTERFFEEAIESWPESDLNPGPLNSIKTLWPTELSGHEFNSHSKPTLYSYSNFIVVCSVSHTHTHTHTHTYTHTYTQIYIYIYIFIYTYIYNIYIYILCIYVYILYILYINIYFIYKKTHYNLFKITDIYLFFKNQITKKYR